MKTKDEIFGQVTLRTETVHIPEWGGDVRVREMPALERYRAEQGYKKLGIPEGDNSSLPAWFVAHTVVNADGSLFFVPEDYERLNSQPAHVISKLFNKCCDLNHLTKSDQEELIKNSEASRIAGSSSGSV